MKDLGGEAFRREVYGRLEQDDPTRWEELRGCTVKHAVFGEGTISHVMMPDWSNPVHLVVRFGQRERMFHLSSFGDGTKFRTKTFPAQLAGAIARAEQEITEEAQRIEEDLQRRESAAREAVLCREEQEATRVARQRHADEQQEIARLAHAEAMLAGIHEKADRDQPLTADEMRLLLKTGRHDLLLGYYSRSYARTNDYRPLVKAGTTWREATQPEYALKATALLLEGIDRLPGRARAAVFTARAGALLDLRSLVEAKECALRAMAADSKSPHPHQLLGVIMMECGDAPEGDRQFARARQLAGPPSAGRFEKLQQAAVKKQLESLDAEKQPVFARRLLRIDPPRYHWVETYLR